MMAMLMGLKSITPQQLHERMQQEALTVIDVNAERSWLHARVPGATHLDADFDAAALPPDRARGLVFYCSNALCRKAPLAARRAQQLGYTDVRVMAAGISGWTGARLPTQSGPA
jgi:rhodanese-related sulfurtransferase